MKFELGQKIIDKIRRKNPDEKEKKFLIRSLKEKGFTVNKDNSIVNVSGGLSLYLDFQPYIIAETFLSNDYNCFKSEKEAIFIDIGMNAGFVSLQFASKDNIKKVYSFEPFAPTYEEALKNISLNKRIAGKIETFMYGLSNKNEKMEVLYEKERAGGMSLVRNVFDYKKDVFDIKKAHKEIVEIKDASKVLKEILDKNKGKQVILKCDTEGSEFKIMESLDNADLLKRIDIILMEYHFKSPKVIEEALLKNNFVMFYKNCNLDKTCGLIYAVKN